jgi:hypothetical protein
MFKMYAVGTYQLNILLLVDALSRRGQSGGERARAAAALAGITVMNTLSAGIIGGLMIEPLRLVRAIWNVMYGDDDEPDDMNSAVESWATEITGNEKLGQALSRGAWNLLGVDLSSRMGLDRMLLFDPPEQMSEDEGYKMIAQALGPIPSMFVQKGVAAYKSAVYKGDPLGAIMDLVPVRAFQDARKSWEIMNRGVTTTGGATVVDPSEFNAAEGIVRALGARTSEESKASDKAATVYKYQAWKNARVRELANAYWRAMDSGDAAAIAAANAAISKFNQRNPGAPILWNSLKQSRQGAEQSAEERRGEGRNPDLRKRLDY